MDVWKTRKWNHVTGPKGPKPAGVRVVWGGRGWGSGVGGFGESRGLGVRAAGLEVGAQRAPRLLIHNIFSHLIDSSMLRVRTFPKIGNNNFVWSQNIHFKLLLRFLPFPSSKACLVLEAGQKDQRGLISKLLRVDCEFMPCFITTLNLSRWFSSAKNSYFMNPFSEIEFRNISKKEWNSGPSISSFMMDTLCFCHIVLSLSLWIG